MHFTYMVAVLAAFAFPAIAAVMRQSELTSRQQTAFADYNSCATQCVLGCTMDSTSKQWVCQPPSTGSSDSSPDPYAGTGDVINRRDTSIRATFTDEGSCFSGCNGMCVPDTNPGSFVCEQTQWDPVDPAHVDPQNGSPRLRPRQQTMFSSQGQCSLSCGGLMCEQDAASGQWSCQDPVPTSADGTDSFAGKDTGVKPRAM